VREAAVIAMADGDAGVRITAFISCHNGNVPSIIELKAFCAQQLPSYMSPDVFVLRESLPRTSTDKVDYQALRGTSAQPKA
jgi:acyl-CoA synthetase (AMP-forming)/AMP-acid ligase II